MTYLIQATADGGVIHYEEKLTGSIQDFQEIRITDEGYPLSLFSKLTIDLRTNRFLVDEKICPIENGKALYCLKRIVYGYDHVPVREETRIELTIQK